MRYMSWNINELRSAPESYVKVIIDQINSKNAGALDGDNAF